MLKFIYIDFGSSKIIINCPNKEEKDVMKQEKFKEKVT